VADIVLLKDTLKVLLDVLAKGQRIVKGLLDVLKLYLTQVLYLTLLLVMVKLTAFGLPYHPSQGSVISLITLTIPAFFLSLWAPAGAISSGSMSRRLARFVIPAGVTMSMAGLMVYLTFLLNTSNLHYTQLAVTYTITAMGLILVVFVHLPTPVLAGGDELNVDRRFTWIAVGLFILFLVMLNIPLAQEVFKIGSLSEPLDYLIIGFVVIFWALGVHATWQLRQAYSIRRWKPERSILDAERS
jgi:cation-transporting ATPase E